MKWLAFSAWCIAITNWIIALAQRDDLMTPLGFVWIAWIWFRLETIASGHVFAKVIEE